jgi:pimeloyl-ACP methyl ester carboxylesterase
MIQRLLERYDPEIFELGRREARLRLEGVAEEAVDVVLTDDEARTAAPEGRPDAVLRADRATWEQLVDDPRGGMDAFRTGRLRVRHDLHLGIGFLAATAKEGGGLRFAKVDTSEGELSTMEAGEGPPVVMLHGLGATKASFLPTVAALSRSHRAIAIDLPGFGDSDKPLSGAYDPAFFARAVVALLDALGYERAHLLGNSMGGRVAIEVGLSEPGRVAALGLLAPSLAWLRDRPWAPLLRLVPPQLGAIQPAPRALVQAIVGRAVGDDPSPWTAAGVDEFLRSYLTPAGRAAFYAAARNIYLEEPHGERGFWTRLPQLSVPSLFVWGRQDTLVPIKFADHVRRVLPGADHLELDCGHVPQLEAPRQTHAALARLFAKHPA